MAEKNHIINYFACRQRTEKIVKDIEHSVSKNCHYCRTCDKCSKLQTYRNEFKRSCFWTFNKELKYRTFTIQVGAIETIYLNLDQLETRDSG